MKGKKKSLKYPISSKNKTDVSLLDEVIKLIKGKPPLQSIINTDAEVRSGHKKYNQKQNVKDKEDD